MEFSTAGMSTRSRTGSLRSMIMWASASTLAAPPMSFFISSMALSGLMSSPPVSKQTPLPTSVTLGAAGSPQLMSIKRGGRGSGTADRMDQRKVVLQQIVADGHADGRAVARGERGRGVGEFAGTHVVRGRVDEVAGEIHGLDDAAEVGAVHPFRHLEAHLGGGLAVAHEPIGAERDRDGGEALVVGRIGEAVDAAGQHARKRAGKERIERLCPRLPIRTEPRQGSRRAPEAGRDAPVTARTPRPRRTRRPSRRDVARMSRQVAAVTNQIGTAAAPPRVTNAGCMDGFRRTSPLLPRHPHRVEGSSAADPSAVAPFPDAAVRRRSD